MFIRIKRLSAIYWKKFRRFLSPFDFLFEAIHNFNIHDGMMMAGHLAFLSMLSLFPFIIFLVTLAGFFGQTEAGTEALQQLFEYLPPDVSKILRSPIEQTISGTGTGIMTFSIIGTIWVSSSAIDAARLAIVRSFGTVSRRNYFRRRAEGFLLVILSASAILTGMLLIIFSPIAWKIITDHVPLDMDFTEIESLKNTWNYMSLLISSALVFGALCLAFFILKPRALKIRPPVLAGALATLILWTIIGSLFSKYIQGFSNYNVTYGSLAGPIITLVFFYFTSASFILGAEINASLYHRRTRKL